MIDGVAQLFDRLPPHSLEAERSLIGSVLLSPEVLADLPTVQDDFYSSPHAMIWQAVVDVLHAKGDLDALLVAERLRDLESLEAAGGPEYLVELAESVPSAKHAGHYAKIVSEKARLRRLIEAGAETIHDAFTSSEPASEVIDRAETRMLAAGEALGEASTIEPIGTIARARLKRLGDGSALSDDGISTGYPDLDRIGVRLRAGEFTVLAARPSMGKSSLAMNIADRVARGAPHRDDPDGARGVLVFSAEMGRESVADRHLSMRARVDLLKVRGGGLDADEMARLSRAAREVADLPIVIDDGAGPTVGRIRARTRRESRRMGPAGEPGGLAVVIVDYLQLCEAPASRENRQVEVSAISRGLKALARELGVCVLCVAQLNRQVEGRDDRRPRMSDLRESGSIEQDADGILLLFREEYYHRSDSPADVEWRRENQLRLNKAELIVAKQRNGPTGSVPLSWDGECGLFESWAEYGGYGRGMGPPREA